MKGLTLLGVAAFVVACDAGQAPTAPQAVAYMPATLSNALIYNDKVETIAFASDDCNGGFFF